MEKTVAFVLNGRPVEIEVSPADTLLDVLRDELKLTGTKKGCGQGECGACTVILDGEAVNSCLVPVMKVEGCHVETIEGLSSEEKVHPVQDAFMELGAIQCGFCTPGMIMSSKALLDKEPNPNPGQIKETLSGNICRCTGYIKIEQAVQAAAKRLKSENTTAREG